MTLECFELSAGYGRTPVVHAMNLELKGGEIVSLVGANGAGKSTLLKAISGLIKVSSGRIVYHGKVIDRLSPADRIRLGIVHVPEGRQVFSGMTVEENLFLGGYSLGSRNRRSSIVKRVNELRERYPFLHETFRSPAGNLSGGQQQMLAIARGLMSNPSVVMLDEPSLGLSPLMVIEVFNLIKQLQQEGRSILLSEQNARAALAISNRGYVLESGRVTLSGAGHELLDSSEIAARYLGGAGTATDSRNDESSLAHRLKTSLSGLQSISGATGEG